MNLEKLKPWNWFKDEENSPSLSQQIPVTQRDNMATGDSLVSMRRDIDQLFERFSSALGMPSLANDFGAFARPGTSLGNYYRPQIDVSGDNNAYEIKLDVPGMSEADLSIEVNQDRLLIRGEKQQQSESKDKHYYRVERHYGSFQRTLSLPDDADADEIMAQLENGVLRLEIPRRESASQESKRISISS